VNRFPKSINNNNNNNILFLISQDEDFAGEQNDVQVPLGDELVTGRTTNVCSNLRSRKSYVDLQINVACYQWETIPKEDRNRIKFDKTGAMDLCLIRAHRPLSAPQDKSSQDQDVKKRKEINFGN
jgi:hypothetical protein